MPTTRDNRVHSRLINLARSLVIGHTESIPISGDDYTEPVHGMTVFHKRKIIRDGRRVEINVTTDSARPTFEWLAEIIIANKAAGYYKHFLVRPDDLVETYGKTVLDVEPAQASELAKALETASLPEEIEAKEDG